MSVDRNMKLGSSFGFIIALASSQLTVICFVCSVQKESIKKMRIKILTLGMVNLFLLPNRYLSTALE